MDYAFLPEKIKRFVESEKLGETALCVIRGSGGFSGVPGESYLLAYSKVLYLFGKTFGKAILSTAKLITLPTLRKFLCIRINSAECWRFAWVTAS